MKTAFRLSLRPGIHICGVAIDYLFQELHRVLVIDPPAEDIEECCVINRIKELADIPAPEEATLVPRKKILRAFNRFEQTFPFAARPNVVDERLIIDVD